MPAATVAFAGGAMEIAAVREPEVGRYPEEADGLPGVDKVNDHGRYRELVMSEGTESATVFQALAEAGVDVKRFEVGELPLEDIFIQVVKGTQA